MKRVEKEILELYKKGARWIATDRLDVCGNESVEVWGYSGDVYEEGGRYYHKDVNLSGKTFSSSRLEKLKFLPDEPIELLPWLQARNIPIPEVE